MLATTILTRACPCCGRPRRLAHLLELYERNYRLVEQLLPELDLPFDRAVSSPPSDLPVYLSVVERSPYTVEIRLTYRFDTPDGHRLEPDFWIRIYRDARVAEALRCGRRMPWLAADERDRAAHEYLRDQWTRNHMLLKWLEYLLSHGHGFVVAARPRRWQARA